MIFGLSDPEIYKKGLDQLNKKKTVLVPPINFGNEKAKGGKEKMKHVSRKL